MHAALLDPKSETLKEYVLGLSRDIERTDYHCSTALPLSHQHKTASDVNLLAWTEVSSIGTGVKRRGLNNI